MPKVYRQGDVALVAIDTAIGTERRAGAGRVILARGEVTGHAHTLDAECVSVWNYYGEEMAFITVLRETTLTHEEHAPIVLPPGDYRVVRQREYTPMAPRYVSD
jgi:hypothetical protein